MRTWLMASVVVAAALVAAGPAAGMMDDAYRLRDAHGARESSYDRTGGNADNRVIAPGSTLVLADLKGPGCVRHIWLTISSNEDNFLRKLALRMYWDGEDNPSVEAPIGDFLGVGHGIVTHFISLPLATVTGRGFNCCFPMPFNKSARITVTNDGEWPVAAFFYHVDYERREKPYGEDAGYFHARWHRENPTAATDGSPNTTGAENYVILDARGRGHYAGCNYSVHQLSPGWWGEGDDMMFIDGEEKPSIVGTGSEDYFGSAWGFAYEYAGDFVGCTIVNRPPPLDGKTCVYRYHILDPVHFQESLRVTIEHGHANDRSDDISSCAYWYQTEPHYDWSPLPPVGERIPRGSSQPQAEQGAAEGKSLAAGADVHRTLDEWFTSLPQRCNADAAKDVRAVYHFHITGEGGGDWAVTVADGKCAVAKGAPGKADLKVWISAADAALVIAGQMNGMDAWSAGKLVFEGDPKLALKMVELFGF